MIVDLMTKALDATKLATLCSLMRCSKERDADEGLESVKDEMAAS